MTKHDCRRCDWRPQADTPKSPPVQLADHAATTNHPLCILCATSLGVASPLTCTPCVADTRKALTEITALYQLLRVAMLDGAYGQPSAVREGPTSSGDTSFPGGDQLAMLADGSRATEQIRAGDTWTPVWTCGDCGQRDVVDRARHLFDAHRSTDWSRLPGMFTDGGLRRTDAGTEIDVERDGDPQSVAFELGRWEDDWRLTRGEPAADDAMTVTGATEYLNARMGWAGDNHLEFDEFAGDLQRILGRLRTATATDVRSRTGAPCFTCGTALRRDSQPRNACTHERPTQALLEVPLPEGHEGPRRLETVLDRDRRLDAWTAAHAQCRNGGLSDDWRCPRCRRVYTGEAYLLLVRSQHERAVLDRRHQVGWTTAELAAELGITQSGVRHLVRRNHITRVGTGEGQAALYDHDQVLRVAHAEQPADLEEAG